MESSTVVNQIFFIFGGLGLFLFGMKLLSDSLQKAAGDNIRKILASMTRNKFLGVISGFLITSIIQTSSGTTVTVVSLVNAGLLTLQEAVSVIMGANIGTTFTAWMIAFLGFKVNISFFALPIIAIGAMMYFLRSGAGKKAWAEVLIGFGLLFLGLEYLKNGVPDVSKNPEIFSFLCQFNNKGFMTFIFFILLGTAITCVVQSSSATVALTITLAMKGWIPFGSAAAMVLGENIGTTITALIASLPANRMAKRAALSHTLFNLFGVFLIFFFFTPFIKLVDWLWPGDPLVNVESVRFHLSLFHSMFNIITMLLLVWFIPYFVKIVTLILKIKPGEEEYHLKYIGSSMHGSSELRIIEAQKEIQRMGDITLEMYKDTIDVVFNPNKKMGKIIDKINKYEGITDMLEKEISDYLANIAKFGISEKSAVKITGFFNISNDLERIADHCTSMIRLAVRKYEKKISFTPSMFGELEKINTAVTDFLSLNVKTLSIIPERNFKQQSLYFEEKINSLRDKIKKEHTKLLMKGKEEVNSGILLMDMVTNLEKIGDHCFNITQALIGEK